VHAVEEAKLVGVLSEVREEFGNRQPAFPLCWEIPWRLKKGPAVAALSGGDEIFAEDLAVVLLELRLEVESIDVRGTSSRR
jgi:hypothetical protein